MRTGLLCCICWMCLASCSNERVIVEPVWINAMDTLIAPDFRLAFLTDHDDWETTIYSAVQPVPVVTHYESGKLTIMMKHQGGIIEGPAKICISREDWNCCYPVVILNETNATVIEKDYRSPKTVNPDSSLQQQQIMVYIDDSRNLVSSSAGKAYFIEKEISLPTKAATYRAQQEAPLSSYYVQPGSTTNIPLNATYQKASNCFIAEAGPLYDAHGNVIADGTLVSFIYSDDRQTFRKEAMSQNGVVEVTIPANDASAYQLKAAINQTVSSTIQLIP